MASSIKLEIIPVTGEQASISGVQIKACFEPGTYADIIKALTVLNATIIVIRIFWE